MFDRRILESPEQRDSYQPVASARLMALAAAHGALFIAWRRLDGRAGKQGLADKCGAKMTKVWQQMLKEAC